MNTNIQIFKNSQFGEVRVTEANGELHFVAKDVAEILGYKWQPNIVGHLPDEWRGVNPINTPGGKQEVITLSEQGLYFFLARSDKPSALPFQKWIAGEVIPSIRKTGGYLMAGPDDTPELIMARALQIAQITIENHKQQLQIAQGTIEHQQEEIKQLAPKADYTDTVLQSTSTYTMTQVAKELGMSALALEKRLRESGVMFKQSGQWILYAKYQGKGYTKTRTHHYTHSDGTTGTNTITVWTERGRAFIHSLFDTNMDLRRQPIKQLAFQ